MDSSNGVLVSVVVDGGIGTVAAWDRFSSDEPLESTTFEIVIDPQTGRGDFESDFLQLRTILQRFERKYRDIGGIGVGVAGMINDDRNTVVMSGILPHWVDYNIGERLHDEFSCEVVLGNNVEVAAAYEKLCGLGQEQVFDKKALLMLQLGMGINACRVASKLIPVGNGQFMVNCLPLESGHGTVDPGSRFYCTGCSDPGHLEALCGHAHLLNRFGVTDLSGITDHQWNEVVSDLVYALQNILVNQNVSRVVVYGSVIAYRPSLIKQLQSRLDRVIYRRPRFHTSAFIHDEPRLASAAHFLLLLSRVGN